MPGRPPVVRQGDDVLGQRVVADEPAVAGRLEARVVGVKGGASERGGAVQLVQLIARARGLADFLLGIEAVLDLQVVLAEQLAARQPLDAVDELERVDVGARVVAGVLEPLLAWESLHHRRYLVAGVGLIAAERREDVLGQSNVALLGDKKFIFAPDATAFLMYGRFGSSWISMGDPIGDPRPRQT